MIKLLRSFFGLNGSSSKRMVVGSSVSFDPKEISYINDSNNRLAALLNLYKKYKGTQHADKIKAVYEKTKQIHSFLLSKNRVHELELFHIQHTEHFINTFTLIIDVHQRHKEGAFAISETEPEVTPKKESEVKEPELQAPLPKVEQKSTRNQGELFEIAERARYKNKQRPAVYNKQASAVYIEEPATEVPKLIIPEISIDTIAKVFYFKEDVSGKQVPHEISFISTQQEKEAFQAYISARLGMKNIYYVGNARIYNSNSKNANPEEMLPVIYWSKYSYALTLHDYRIFPVTINRRSL